MTNNCYCYAYKFPHRLHSGRCKNTSLIGPFCGFCRKACDANIIDTGIGGYEYWGNKGFDKRLELVSLCCGAEIFYDQFLTKICTMKDFEKDNSYT